MQAERLSTLGIMLVLTGSIAGCSGAQSDAGVFPADPGVRAGPGATGDALAGLTPLQEDFFLVGKDDFESAETTAEGLGPRMNLDSCEPCHSQPAVGGSSPAINPQIAFATAFGQANTVPSFLALNGPVREAHFKFNSNGTRDGGVHELFVITGREDGSISTAGCDIAQEDFAAQLRKNNVIFRIPTPLFGLGLIEQIPDRAILDNLNANANSKASLQISGRVNRDANSRTISRFGWKAQGSSLLLFGANAYDVEMGISNELQPMEREQTASCQFAVTPNDVTRTADPKPDAAPAGGNPRIVSPTAKIISDVEKFAFFMRLLAPPVASSTEPGGAASIAHGRQEFDTVGCSLCHTPTLTTGPSAVTVLSNQNVDLFSDLALHNMGPMLADDIVQGSAAPDEFRTAPLWGLGQRVFFLHDGRTADLQTAIAAHRSAANRQFGPSEANRSIDRFDRLPPTDKQDLLNFLRSL